MNQDSVAETMASLGRMIAEQPQIQEVDLNPVRACQDGCLAVDARIMIKTP
jgi:acetyltransferase